MPTEILMPPLPNREDGRLARWFVTEGSRIAAGDVIAEVETDSATLEIEASGEGRIERLLITPGHAIIPCGTPLALVGRAEAPEPQPASQPRPVSGAAQSLSLVSAPSEAIERAAPHANGQGRSAAPAPVMLTGREALRDALADALARDADVVVIGTDVDRNAGAEAVTQGLTDAFGGARIVPVLPLQQAFAGLAVGASLAGLKPIVCLEDWAEALPMLSALAKIAPLAARTPGESHSATSVFRGPWIGGRDRPPLSVWLAAIPGLKVVSPATPQAAYALIGAALEDGGPVAVLEPASLYDTAAPVIHNEEGWSLSKARVVRAGRDVSVATYGAGLASALAAAGAVAGEGIESEIIDLVSLAPIDVETVLTSVRRTGRLLGVAPDGQQDPVLARVVSAVAEQGFASLIVAPARCGLRGDPESGAEGSIEAALRALAGN